MYGQGNHDTKDCYTLNRKKDNANVSQSFPKKAKNVESKGSRIQKDKNTKNHSSYYDNGLIAFNSEKDQQDSCADKDNKLYFRTSCGNCNYIIADISLNTSNCKVDFLCEC